MKNKKKIVLIISVLFVVIVLALATSYALFTINVTKNSNFKMIIGNLELSITDTTTEDKFIMESTVPTKDEVALSQDGYTFTITNTGTLDSYYTVYLDDILLSDAGERLDNSYVKLNLFDHTTNKSITRRLTDYQETERLLASGYLEKGKSITYTLKMWVDYDAGNEAQNKYFATQIRVVGTQSNAVVYEEGILNGTDPVLTDNLVPVVIADDGTVTKANLYSKWYSYEDKKWANAVVLKSDKNYKNGEEILEENIESYFVWIPKYSYQLWDLGYYSNMTYFSLTYPFTIKIKFGTTDTIDGNVDECSTVSIAGTSGSAMVGCYMTHPAFQNFDSSGFWVGKFETGYDGATSASAAQVNSSDSSKIIIKPNVYSWRSLTLGNMFKASYEYLRSSNSHMMKNTEWGAVAYLQHSSYGSAASVRVNNNSNYITGYAAVEEPTVGYNTENNIEGNRIEGTALSTDGTYTVNYLNSLSGFASTTGNKTGVYDMSGGACEYVSGYTTSATTQGGASEIISLYSNFFDDYKEYYDKYSSTNSTNYNNRILGDATGELGPFNSEQDPDETVRYKSSWYADISNFVISSSPWFSRGGNWSNGTGAGVFSFDFTSGENDVNGSFRIVLTPTK